MDLVSVICEEIRKENFEKAIHYYSSFFHRLINVIIHNDRNGIINSIIERQLKGETNFHSLIVHLFYYLLECKKNKSKTEYVTTQNYKKLINEADTIKSLTLFINGKTAPRLSSIYSLPYVFLSPNFDYFLSVYLCS